MSSGLNLTRDLKSMAELLGFDLCGVSPAAAPPHAEFLSEWLERGYAGAMAYLTRRADDRADPTRLLEGAKSVVSVGLVYAGADAPIETPTDAPARARVSRYARGDDYHELVLDRLRALASGLEVLAGQEVRSRCYVDTGPVLERAHAAQAGLGWIGKNTCLIHPRLGSYLFLGALITDLELEADAPEPDHCGSCRACLDACPTDAFAEPYVLDARLCLAYTTIEDRGSVPEGLRTQHGDRVFGCDVCQEVCPWNQRPPPLALDRLGLRERLRPRPEWEGPSLEWILGLDETAWLAATRRSALRRSKRRGLIRSALVAAGNSADRRLIPSIERHAQGPDSLIAEHARWALARLDATG